jgi:hypothetical protein
MKTQLTIASAVAMSHRQVSLNGSAWHSADEALDLPAFTREVYRKLEMNYLKFYKMDDACKQGIVCGEMLIRSIPDFDRMPSDRIGICLGGSKGSLDTDQRYFATYGLRDDTIPSPGLFVYTLPNILIGELCIRHKITGEQACFVIQQTQLECLYLYTSTLFEMGRIDACILGWNDVYDGTNQCLMTWITRSDEGAALTENWYADGMSIAVGME